MRLITDNCRGESLVFEKFCKDAGNAEYGCSVWALAIAQAAFTQQEGQPSVSFSPAPSSTDTSPSLGSILVAAPSRSPIPKGSVVVPNEGFGAVVCPDSNALAAYDDAAMAWFVSSGGPKTDGSSPKSSSVESFRTMAEAHGCDYFSPGTSLVSEGGNPIGSLAVVTAQMPNGTRIRGVTFPTMITQSQQLAVVNQQVQVPDSESSGYQPVATQEPKPALEQASTPSAYTPDVPQEPKSVPVENPNLPTQPSSIGEIDQQAIALWNLKRYSDAFPLFNQGCNSGNADSCYHLGLMYDFGQGVTQDLPHAEALYSKSCNAGNGAACYYSSMLPQSITGGCNSGAVTRNLSRSCDMGIAASCSMIGFSYIHGCGVAKDVEKGRKLLSKGCSLGDYNACDGIK
jgi:hypothetical protein